MLVTVSIGCNRIFINNCETNGWFLANLQAFPVTALICLQVYPLDAVIFFHRMMHRTYGYMNNAIFHTDYWCVLLLAAVCCTGL